MQWIAVWRLIFQTRQYLRGSLWFLPLLGGLAGAALGLGAPLDRGIEAPESLQYSASTASTLLSAIVGSTAALTGFVVTVAILVVQMATGTFSARYMRLWYRDRLLHVLLASLVGTFTFSFTLLAGVEEASVPNLGITASGALMAVEPVPLPVLPRPHDSPPAAGGRGGARRPRRQAVLRVGRAGGRHARRAGDHSRAIRVQ